ncbi:MAG: TonB-dependent receptor plug domain-containing protein, partial [Bacteroidales bacterium]|nr:TonB-dependent receptor plug domain-containing protein [Bacteroidales bacterium]
MMKSNLHRKRLSAVRVLLFLSVLLMLSTSNLNAVINDNDLVQDVRHQKKRISGIIRDVNGAPVIGAGVIESKRPSNGTVSDLDGRFTLEVENDSSVEISCLGYASQEVATFGKTSLEIIMVEDERVLDEVVVLGYGSQSRATLTTAVSKLDNKALENIPYTNAASALQGGVPGLTVQSYNGQPGLAPRIVLRGGTSIENPEGSSPLYIVDGVIRPDMDDIPASDISSIQVLKDAASTAIYGARASNGVILITTKTGGEGPAKVTFSYDLSIANEAKELELISAGEYIVAARQSIMWRAEKDPTAIDKLTQATGYGTGNN